MEDLHTDNAIKVLGVFTAISVVLYALWAEYFCQYIEEALSSGLEKIDHKIELRNVRTASSFAAMLQVLIFFAGRGSAPDKPLVSAGLLFTAILLQMKIQSGVEKRIAPKKTYTGPVLVPDLPPAQDSFGLKRKGMAWIGFNILVYWGALLGSLRGFAALAHWLHATDYAAAALLLGGAALGVFAGLGLNFALAPVHLRRILPTTEIADSKLKGLLEKCFARAGVALPGLWVIETGTTRWANALIAGFRSGRGWARPCLFVTRTLIESLSESELEAVILHEVSHVSLNHARKRFIYGFFIVIASSFLAGLIFMASLLLPLSSDIGTVLKICSLAIPLAFPMILLKRQVRRHELEADENAVLSLGAQVESLASSLTKLDLLNQADGSAPGNTGYPSTQERILKLRSMVQETRRAA